MQARETSTDWSLKRRSDDVDEEFGEFEEDKELDEDFDDDWAAAARTSSRGKSGLHRAG
jgi:hypothetical protein